MLGFAGLVGSGRTEVAEALFGVRPADAGVIRRDGEVVDIRAPRDAMARGIAYVSEDRRRLGLSLPQSVTANITLPGLRRFVSRWRLVDRTAERRAADVYRQRLRIMSPSLLTPVGNLSGGNQQKVMLAKWLDTKPSVIIFDEPTRGIDVGTKADVHELIGEMARAGVAVILISSDLPEVLAMSDRVLVDARRPPDGDLRRDGSRAGAHHDRRGGGHMISEEQVVVLAGERPVRRRSRLQPERLKGLSLLGVLVLAVVLFSLDRRRLPQRPVRRPPARSRSRSPPSSPPARRS